MQIPATDRRQPRIAVVIPSYNCLQYLPRALLGIYAQRFEALEILVADDGSTDGSRPWLRARAAKDRRLRLIETPRLGPAEARNRCIAASSAEYIAFLDADDVWRPGKLRAQLAFHEANPDVVFSFTDYRRVSATGVCLGNGFEVWPEFRRRSADASGYRILDQALARLFAENPVGTSTVMVRRDALQNEKVFDSALPSAEDLDLWLRLADRGAVGFCPQASVDYLVRQGSESTKSEQRLAALEMIHHRYRALAARVDPAAERKARARLGAARAQHMRALNRHSAAFVAHLGAFARHPTGQGLKAVLVDMRSLLQGAARPKQPGGVIRVR